MIQYQTVSQFGHLRRIILDTKVKEAFKKLTDRSTLSLDDIESLKVLGVECVSVEVGKFNV